MRDAALSHYEYSATITPSVTACSRFSKHWGFPVASLTPQMRHLHSCRTTLLQDDPTLTEKPAEVWAKVLGSCTSDDTAEAEAVVQASLTTQTRSAVNERSFAAVETVKQFCGSHITSETINKYVWIMTNGPRLDEASVRGGLIDTVRDQWFAANPDNRFAAVVPEGMQKHGRKIFRRLRAKVRSDKGTHGIRKRRLVTKKWSQLRVCQCQRFCEVAQHG